MNNEYLATLKTRCEKNQRSLAVIAEATEALERAMATFDHNSLVIDENLINQFKSAEKTVNFAVISLKEDADSSEE